MGFGKDARYYDIPGVGKLPSVTTIQGAISKPALYAWYEKQGAKKAFDILMMLKGMSPFIHDAIVSQLPGDFLKGGVDKLEEAGNTGTEAHSCFERFLKGETIDISTVSESARASVQTFLDVIGVEKFAVIKSECQVHSKKYGYAGTLDAIVRIDERVVLRDWKTSSGIYPEHAMQGVAYKVAVEEMTGEKVDDVEIIRFSKKVEPFNPSKDRYVVPRNQHDYLFAKFLNVFETWKWQNKKDVPDA